jgi:hypothetical protein
MNAYVLADRGTWIHRALERFVREFPQGMPADALDRLLAIGRQEFGPQMSRPAVGAFWWPRFQRIARWFVDNERERRVALATLHAEVKGWLQFDGPAGPFIVTATADRIECGKDGRLAIIDYKTARCRVRARSNSASPHSCLERRSRAGGFCRHRPGGGRGTGVLAPDRRRSRRGDQGGEGRSDGVHRCGAHGLQRLVAAFDAPTTAYQSEPDPGVRAALQRLRPSGAGEGMVGRRTGRGGMTRPAASVVEQASAIQRRAADAQASVWVDASAGTGKTTVLVSRVLRLLVEGVRPERILCITYTKAAAAEMANRISARLQEWAAMPGISCMRACSR